MISITGLAKKFGSTPVLRGIDLHIERGTIFALLGPNGAGKTTLINILSTLVRPDAGTASINGHDVVRDRAAVKHSISVTGQSAAVDEVLTGEENLRMMARLSGMSPRLAAERAEQLLEQFDLLAARGRRVKTYSGGMRRRLDLAISFTTTPAVVFLDEPTTGLDTGARRDLWQVIRSLTAAGTTVFLTTQYLEEADQLADRIAVLNGGVIVAEGTVEELKSRIGSEVVALLDTRGEIVRRIPTDGTVAGLRAALDEFDDDDASVALQAPSLDDVFLSLTRSDTEVRS